MTGISCKIIWSGKSVALWQRAKAIQIYYIKNPTHYEVVTMEKCNSMQKEAFQSISIEFRLLLVPQQQFQTSNKIGTLFPCYLD